MGNDDGTLFSKGKGNLSKQEGDPRIESPSIE